MNEVQIHYHPDATAVALVLANGEYWLWFTTGPHHRMRPQIIGRQQLRDAMTDECSSADAAAYLEIRMQVAGYKLQRSLIQSGDLAVWYIASD
jgi:hypothetical protein